LYSMSGTGEAVTDAGTRALAQPALAIWGDPIVGKTLVLLLRPSGYDARFLPISSLSKPESWDSVQLLLLAPTPEMSTKQREAHLALLKDETGGAKEVQVLELLTPTEEPPEGGARDGSWHAAPWPCKIEELERRIGALLRHRSI
jgi:hypothetical protein